MATLIRFYSLRLPLLLVSIMLLSIAVAFHQTPTIPSSPGKRIILKAETDANSIEDSNASEESNRIQGKGVGSNRAKQALLESFQEDANAAPPSRLHAPTKERTALVTDMIKANPTPAPGSTESFASLAPGIWRVVYAPHIAALGIAVSRAMSALFSRSPLFAANNADAGRADSDSTFSLGFDPVYYLLRPDGTVTSHARLVINFGKQGKSVTWFSVAGTYSSQDEDRVCRVDFDEAWVQTSENNAQDPLELPPYASLDEVPASFGKSTINALGRLFFVDAVSTFPVSYLDDDCVVFDFELLGTRICAKKVHQLLEDGDKGDDTVLQFLADKER